ncbi:MAG: hypothetical protein CMH32_05775 [Micavibrio sp.]|nr:hypothetical protein [Micavibrio sp.]HCK31979.1 hypothetical protein [Rhodospirillaceae bacterium]|tara:strand:- start:110 stop:583 length:474 start_codon:yes stop_codon:yes gene_type:complete
MRKYILAAVTVLSVGLAGCQTTNTGPKEGVGTLGGAVLGGLAGSQIGGGSGRLWTAGAGALLGAYLGGEVGRSLDSADRMAMGQATQRAQSAPLGQEITWNNPDTGNSGSITPVRDGTASSGEYCREYQTEITVGGQKETGYGTACQQPDGSWKVIN